MKENERLTLKSVNGDVWLLDSEEKPYLLSVDGDDYNKALNRLAEYETIGTIEEFKDLKEKNTPKKVAYQVEHEKCPTCGSFHVFGKHCTECGQAVDYD